MLSAPLRTEFLVVRHSEVHNPRNIVYARLPRFGLSRRGYEQAFRTARFLAVRSPDVIYTSPLLRARQTAEALSAHLTQVRVLVARRLVEVKTAHQGSSNAILKPGFSFYEPLKHAQDETIGDVFFRVLLFLKQAIRRHAGERIVAVSHADPITIMRAGLENRPLTAAGLRSTVYPARSSITQIVVQPSQPLFLAYFNVADVEEVKL